jgi:polyisoprenoid-binding protein YceI
VKSVACLAALCLATLPSLSLAAQDNWPIDPALSQTQFSVRKFWFAHVRGTFPRLHGTLHRIDTHIGADLGVVDAELDVADLRMDDADKLAHALGPEFFDAAHFPELRFDSDPFPLSELVTGGKLDGMLLLHGKRHPVALTLLPSNCPRQPLACVIRVRGQVSRSRFGMHAWRGVLADKVEIDLRIRVLTDMQR